MKQGDAEAIVRIERQTWDRCASTYLQDVAKLTSHAVPALIEACHLAPGQSAIEIGCGPGHIANMLAQTGAEIVGVDLSPQMVQLAKSLYPGLTFQHADVEQLPFDAENFDAALINFAIHHFARPERACAEVHRILKSKGRFVFAAPKLQNAFGAFMDAVNTHHTLDELPHGPIYMEAEQADYQNLLADGGFKEFDIELRQISLMLEDLNPLLAAGWNICSLDTLPQATQDKIAAATRENAAPFKTPNGYEFPDTIFVGIAVKA